MIILLPFTLHAPFIRLLCQSSKILEELIILELSCSWEGGWTYMWLLMHKYMYLDHLCNQLLVQWRVAGERVHMWEQIKWSLMHWRVAERRHLWE